MFKCYKAFVNRKSPIYRITLLAIYIFLSCINMGPTANGILAANFVVFMIIIGGYEFSEINTRKGHNTEFIKINYKKDTVLIRALRESLVLDLISLCLVAIIMHGNRLICLGSFTAIVLGRLLISKVYASDYVKKIFIYMAAGILNFTFTQIICQFKGAYLALAVIAIGFLAVIFCCIFISMSRKNEMRNYYE